MSLKFKLKQNLEFSISQIPPTIKKLNASQVKDQNIFSSKIPTSAQNTHFWQKCSSLTYICPKYLYLPKLPISAQDEQLRQLCGRSFSVRCLDPAVDYGEEQGHQEVPWRTLRVREDHHCQGWMRSRWHASPAKWFQVIKACRCLDREINPLGIYLWFKVFNLWGGRVSFCQRNLFNLNLPSRIYVGGQKCVLWLMVFLWR